VPVDVKSTTLITLAQARAWVLNDAAEASADDVLVVCANAASERLERWTSRVYKSRAVSETFDGDGFASIQYLSRFPVISLTSFTIDAVTVDASRYALDALRGRLLLKDGAFPSGVQNVAAGYTAGYADADLPVDAIEIALELCKRLYRLKTSGGGVFQQVNVGNSSFIVRDRIPDDMRDAINRLRDTRFG
jgi:hypothetical protein